jgi:hypothetical protein
MADKFRQKVNHGQEAAALITVPTYYPKLVFHMRRDGYDNLIFLCAASTCPSFSRQLERVARQQLIDLVSDSICC